MRFSYADPMIDPGFYLPLVREAEAAGWDTFIVPDSICYPEESDSTYPYTPDGSREFLEDKPFIEPFSLIPALAAVTETIRFTTFVVKLPVRHPVLAAKSATSVAVLSQNRFGLGVGISPWPEDYEICDQPWAGRGRRMNEMIEIVRGLSGGGYFSFSGEFYEVPSLKIAPVPTERLPILVGGHSAPALRRAARLGDGWMHAGGDGADLGAMIAQLGELRDEYDRSADPFEIHAISLDSYSLEGIKRLADIGVTDVIVGFRDAYAIGPDTQSLQDKTDDLKRFADEIIARA